ncbi:MAG: copper-translocating P-type ATPase [Desulfovibrionaceae bacterium]|nr:copper-translocating P-type ATPase [Desulfovibrionaceae bacterium]MBF0513449.1 copper-translocating P-type ATPase [Desulfovibrionaceae bacterium]
MEKVQAAIKGMHCAACSGRIERVVGGLPGVGEARVNLADETGRFAFDPARTTWAAIEKTIAGLGFAAELLEGDDFAAFEERARQARDALAKTRRSLFPQIVLAGLLLLVSMGRMLGLPLPGAIDPALDPAAFALVQLALVLPVLWIGRRFYTGGFAMLARLSPNMDSLIAVGTGAAFVQSLWRTALIVTGRDPEAMVHDLYFESAAVIVALISLGKYFEARSKARASQAIRELMELAPDTATLVRGGEQVEVKAAELSIGDLVRVKPGGRVPVDGLVVEGASHLDESMLTGESMPVAKGPGDELAAGTLNGQGSLVIRALRVGKGATLARIVRLVSEAQGSKAPIANLADAVSAWFVPAVMALATAAALLWWLALGADFAFSLRIFVSVMVIACPCAMGLATPASLMVGMGRGARLGVLFRNGAALQAACGVQVICFDKTGTLTKGKPELTDFILLANAGPPEDELLRLAAGAESASEHPLAEAVARAAKDKGLAPAAPLDFMAEAGGGVAALVDGRRVAIGNPAYMLAQGVSGFAEEAAARIVAGLAEDGKSPLCLAVDGAPRAVLGVADAVREDSARVVAELAALGLRVVMLTGDNPATARAVARRVGIAEFHAGIKPEDKAAIIKDFQAKGLRTAMAGDGINDAPALALADVGLAMGGASGVAMESGDIVLLRGGIGGVLTALSLSRATVRNIKQNLFWAFGYNVILIPVAAGALHLFGGPTLNPMIAGAAMAASSASVVGNALRLRFFGEREEETGGKTPFLPNF